MTSFWFQQLHLKDISHIVEEEDSFSSVSSQHYASQCDRFPIVSILIFSLSTPFHTCFIMRTPPHAAWEAPWMLCLRFIRTISHDLLCFAATSVFRRWETPKPNVSTRLSYPSASRGPRRTSLQRSSSGTSMIRRSTWIRSLTYRCSGWVLTHRQEESSVLQTGSGDRK